VALPSEQLIKRSRVMWKLRIVALARLCTSGDPAGWSLSCSRKDTCAACRQADLAYYIAHTTAAQLFSKEPSCGLF